MAATTITYIHIYMCTWAYKYNMYKVQLIKINLSALFYFCQREHHLLDSYFWHSLTTVFMKHHQDNLQSITNSLARLLKFLWLSLKLHFSRFFDFRKIFSRDCMDHFCFFKFMCKKKLSIGRFSEPKNLGGNSSQIKNIIQLPCFRWSSLKL